MLVNIYFCTFLHYQNNALLYKDFYFNILLLGSFPFIDQQCFFNEYFNVCGLCKHDVENVKLSYKIFQGNEEKKLVFGFEIR